MFRRLAAVGAPPLLLVLTTLLLIHYQANILNVFWNGALPAAWRNVATLLPALLAVAGGVMGFRLRSCGIVIIMLTLVIVIGAYDSGGMGGLPLMGTIVRDSPAFSFLMPLNFLVGLWTIRHSWWSRRSLWAVVVVGIWSYSACWAAPGGPGAVFIRPIIDGMTQLPSDVQGLTGLWEGGLPAVITAVLLFAHGVRSHDPVAAGLSASLLMTLPSVLNGLDDLSRAIGLSAAVLVVLVGVLEAMYSQAFRDGLTGLPGRRSLNDMLRQLGGRFAIAMVDVDHFKRFNDRFGHRTGDDVLKMIAARMRRIPRGRPFRYGGEEFAVIFTGRAARKAPEHMEDFRKVLAATPFVIRRVPRSDKKARGRKTTRIASRQQVRITVSIGVAAPQTTCRKADAVLAAADKALYRAKKNGRNRVVA